jgi:hypothetical protein
MGFAPMMIHANLRTLGTSPTPMRAMTQTLCKTPAGRPQSTSA